MSIKLFEDFTGQFGRPSELPLKQWNFPCGEAGIKIETNAFTFLADKDYTIQLLWEGDSDLMKLAQLVDALRNELAARITLSIPYFPYSRQDRRCFRGEGHALKVVGAFINSLDFDEVHTLDAHSYVLEAVVDRLKVIPQGVCAYNLPKHDILIAPDAGAAKKVLTHSQVTQLETVALTADKQRDSNGKIVSTILASPWQVADMSVCVVDDLCDGGATFIELGKVVKPFKPRELNLYVTHGFFTKGLDALKEIYNNIYVHNLMRPEFKGQVTEI